jgi:hypothetical protein
MKRVVLCFLVLLVLTGTLFCSSKLGLSLDLGTAQDFILKKESFQATGDFRFSLPDGFELRLPLGFTKNGSSSLLEVGVMLNYYPWESGPFMGLSLFAVGFSNGSEVLENLINLNEVLIGWTFKLGHGLLLEPSLCIRDPSGTFSEEYSRIKGTFPCYSTFRFRLSFGWFFVEV